jgi:ligand-binding SRPBCC domain-containing protein
MPIYTLKRKQVVHTSLETAWDFFTSPKNLQRITPPHLGFEILSELPEKVYTGLMIQYRVRPMLGIPVIWLTEITHVKPGEYFVDEQRHGPYRIWHHEHQFAKLGPDQVEMTDIITYQLPFGPLGALVHPWLVKPQLEQIFNYRTKVVTELFS